jgi:hypothetical protein
LVHRFGLPATAEVALAAEHRQAGDDVVAGLDVGDVAADGLDDAGRLVAEDRGRRVRVLALHEVEVAVAAAGGAGLDEHLARSRLVDLDLVDDEASPGMVCRRQPSRRFPLRPPRGPRDLRSRCR